MIHKNDRATYEELDTEVSRILEERKENSADHFNRIEDIEKIPTNERSSFSLNRQRTACVDWTANS
jgi:response regulator RpfG family c-di-GMP phosphodiesterase